MQRLMLCSFQEGFRPCACTTSSPGYLACLSSNWSYLNCMTPNHKRFSMPSQSYIIPSKTMSCSSSSNLLNAVVSAKDRRKINSIKIGNGAPFIWTAMLFRLLSSRFRGLVDMLQEMWKLRLSDPKLLSWMMNIPRNRPCFIPFTILKIESLEHKF